MNNAKFKEQFNTLYNNINNNAAPGLLDAEISTFLNKAQDEIVKSHVLGPTTTYQLGINQTSKRDVELDSLVKKHTYTYDSTVGLNYHPKGKMFFLTPTTPSILVVLSESITPAKLVDGGDGELPHRVEGSILDVTELSYTQLNKFISGPYKYPKKNQAWKIRHGGKVEIIFPVDVYNKYNTTDYSIFSYNLIYVKTPQQIDVSSSDTNKSCELPEVLHPEILQRAVELAKAAYATQDVNVQLSMGQRSE